MNTTIEEPRKRGTQMRRAALSTAVTVTVLALAWVAGAGTAGAATPDTAVLAVWNPLEGITPDFSLWGTGVGDTWRRLMGAFWAACLAICAIWVVAAGAKMASANKRGFAGQQVEAKQSFYDALTGLGACAGASIIIVGVLFAVSG